MQFLSPSQIRRSWPLLVSTLPTVEPDANGVDAAEVRRWMKGAFGKRLSRREQLSELFLQPPNPFERKRRLPKVGLVLFASVLLGVFLLFLFFNLRTF